MKKVEDDAASYYAMIGHKNKIYLLPPIKSENHTYCIRTQTFWGIQLARHDIIAAEVYVNMSLLKNRRILLRF